MKHATRLKRLIRSSPLAIHAKRAAALKAESSQPLPPPPELAFPRFVEQWLAIAKLHNPLEARKLKREMA